MSENLKNTNRNVILFCKAEHYLHFTRSHRTHKLVTIYGHITVTSDRQIRVNCSPFSTKPYVHYPMASRADPSHADHSLLTKALGKCPSQSIDSKVVASQEFSGESESILNQVCPQALVPSHIPTSL